MEAILLTVVDAAGRPVPAAEVLATNPELDLGAVDPALVMARTDGAGKARVALGELAGMTLAVVSGRYFPATFTARAGETLVTLRERVWIDYSVVDADGAPVAGLRADVTVGPLRGEDLRTSAQPGVRVGGFGNVVATGFSTAEGMLRLPVPRGRWNVILNADEKPLLLRDPAEGLRPVDAPFSGQLVVCKPLAAVVDIRGDHVVALQAFGSQGVTAGGNSMAARARATASRRLREKFPDALVVCEVPLRGARQGQAVVQAFGRTSGWLRQEVPMVEFDRIDTPISLPVPSAKSQRSATVRFVITDPRGAEYACGQGDLVLATADVGDGASFPLDGGNEVEVPSGRLTVRPPFTGLPLDFEPMVGLHLSPGEYRTVAIALRSPMRRCRVRIHWDDGSEVSHGSITYWDARGAQRTRLLSSGTVVEGWVAGSAIHYSITAGGRPKVDGMMPIDTTKGPKDLQDLVLRLPRE